MKSNFLKPVATFAIALSCFTACTGGKTSSESRTYSVGAITSNAQLTPQAKAEKLAAIAEQLFTLTNFMHSVELADMALTFDAKNLKAQFYKKAAAPMMSLKGLATRIKPALTAEQLESLNADIEKFPDSALKTFLLDGPEDIKTSKDVQKFLDSYIAGFNDMRVFLKENKKFEATLNANDWSWGAFMQRSMEECVANRQGSYIGDIQCPTKKAGEVKLNAADFEALQHGYGAAQIMFSLYNAYDLTGLVELSQLPEEKRDSMTSSQTWNFLAKFKEFGVYRSTSQLEKVTSMGLDYTTGLRWAMKMQKSLCKKGTQSLENRPGFLFNQGLCVDSKDPQEDEKRLALVELALGGGLLPINPDAAKQDQIMARPALMFTKPIQDLKQLKPVFVKCNAYDLDEHVIAVMDPTLGGIFPGGEFNELLKSSHEEQCLDNSWYPNDFRLPQHQDN